MMAFWHIYVGGFLFIELFLNMKCHFMFLIILNECVDLQFEKFFFFF